MTVVAWKLAQPEFLMPATILEQFGLDALIREAAALLVGEQGSEEDYLNEVEELRDILCFDQDYVALFTTERADWFAIASRAREEHGIDILATDFLLDRLPHADSETHPYCTPPARDVDIGRVAAVDLARTDRESSGGNATCSEAYDKQKWRRLRLPCPRPKNPAYGIRGTFRAVVAAAPPR
jgi:hypothetical protein